MVLEQPPTIFPLIEKDGTVSRPWNEWFTKLTTALNNTDTKTFVTQVSPELTDTITFIKGD